MLKLLAIAALLVGMAGCGEKDSNGNVTGPTPVPQPVSQTMTGTVSAFGTTRHALSVPRNGNMTVTLTWNDPAVDLDLFLAFPSCSQLYPTGACGIVAGSDAARGTNESIARTVSQGESFSVWVDNRSLTRPQSYTLSLSIN